MTLPSPRTCYAALVSRDARFDGRIFVGVTTTGIYCRPICPAGPAKFSNCQFFPSAAAAQSEGFRPCLRCRPEMAPEHGWHGTSSTVHRALQLIATGHWEKKGGSVVDLASRLGVGERHLRRLFQQHLGASPIAVAQTHRILLAKQLIADTQLPMTEVAAAAGFTSIRRFNEVFRKLYHSPPSTLRRSAASQKSCDKQDHWLTVRLRYRAPYDWPAMLAFLRARAIEGVECVDDNCYRRTLHYRGHSGVLHVDHAPSDKSLIAHYQFEHVVALPPLIAATRRVFDTAVDLTAVALHLGADTHLAPLIAKRPGLRCPGSWSGFELAVRAVLGQQVSLEAGRKLAGNLVRLCGSPLNASGSQPQTLHRLFPDPVQVSQANLQGLKMPNARKHTLISIAHAQMNNSQIFEAGNGLEETLKNLRKIPGVGDWTAHYIAMRAAREPDAFPSTDVALLRSSAAPDGTRPKPAQLLEQAEAWKPWRAYAAQHLWAADAAR